MLLTIALFDGLGDLLLVLLWIVLPVSAFSLLVIVLLHYGRKIRKNRSGEEDLYAAIANSAPENFCYRAEDGTLVYLDHTGLLKDYRKKLAYSNARYAALKQDFTHLRSQMDASGYSIPGPHRKHNPIHMEYSNTNLLPQQEVTKEQDRIQVPPSKEQVYLNDLLAERDKQIGFLQGQIDLRVRNYHFAEQEKEELLQKLQRSEQATRTLEEELASLKDDLSTQLEEIKTLQALADEGGRELHESRQTLEARQKQIVYLENVLLELRDQNRLLNAAVADETDRCQALEEQLEAKDSKLKALQEKLATQKQLLQRLYNEVGNCIHEETDTPPVVQLRPDYINPEWEETAAQ